MKKINYPLIILYTRDWNLYNALYNIKDSFKVSEGWISGFLIKENKDSYIVAAEIFPELEEESHQVRYTQAIPKETVLYKKMIHWNKINQGGKKE